MGQTGRNYYREAWNMHLKLLGRIFRDKRGRPTRGDRPSPQATSRPVEDASNRNVEEMEQQSCSHC